MGNTSSRNLRGVKYIDSAVNQTNYILNSAGDSSTNGYVTYSNTAASSPVNGTGGSPSVTFSRIIGTSLNGSSYFRITKDAVNRQGQGFSYDFTIDSADAAKVMQISFNYIINSAAGTFVAGNPSDRTSAGDSDITVWIYDVTNSTLIQPSTYRLYSNSTTIADKFTANFQTSSNSLSYRLIFHIGTTSAVGYQVGFDNITISPSNYVYGTPITDWQSYGSSASFTGFGTPTGITLFWRRAGSNLEVLSRWTTGTGTATEARIAFPSGLTALSTLPTLGIYGYGDTSVATDAHIIVYGEPSASYFTLGTPSPTLGGFSKKNGNSAVLAGTIGFSASVPISGWSSSVQMSDSADTRIVAMSASTANAASTTAGNPLICGTTNFDTHSSYNSSTGRYTVPAAGIYQGTFSVQSSDNAVAWAIYVNGVSVRSISGGAGTTGAANGTGLVSVNVGDILDIRPGGTNDPGACTVTFQRLSGPSAIAAIETIAARFSTSTARTINNTSPTIVYETVDDDSHGAYNSSTGAYTCPAPGRYQISGYFRSLSHVGVIGNLISINVYKNGSLISTFAGCREAVVSATIIEGGGGDLIKCVAGDVLTFRIYSDTATTLIASAPTANHIQLSRIGL